MTRKICILLGLLIAFVSFLSVAQAQTQEKKWKKTVTLPNGEVILDISGEWDVLVEESGQSSYGSYPQKENITLEGGSFVGVRMMNDPWGTTKGSAQLRGELDKDGFKKVSLISAVGSHFDAKGEISEDGNKMVIFNDRTKLTLTRK